MNFKLYISDVLCPLHYMYILICKFWDFQTSRAVVKYTPFLIPAIRRDDL
jgi:hypothetical protein